MNLSRLIQSGKTVFSINDLQKILATDNVQTVRNYASRASKSGILQHIAYGLWGLSRYDMFELASKIKKKSYISFETVLVRAGIVFQHYGNTIFLASDNTGSKNTADTTIQYMKIKDSILLNPLGIEHHGGYMIATPERAICDRLYLSHDYHFDNLSNINIVALRTIAQIYNKRVILSIEKLIADVGQSST